MDDFALESLQLGSKTITPASIARAGSRADGATIPRMYELEPPLLLVDGDALSLCLYNDGPHPLPTRDLRTEVADAPPQGWTAINRAHAVTWQGPPFRGVCGYCNGALYRDVQHNCQEPRKVQAHAGTRVASDARAPTTVGVDSRGGASPSDLDVLEARVRFASENGGLLDYYAVADPSIVLGLIDRVRRLEARALGSKPLFDRVRRLEDSTDDLRGTVNALRKQRIP